jgi:hypothetical protein
VKALQSLRSALGMDGAVTYTFLARLTNIAGSTGTVLLLVRFLSPVEQGYYYTLLSLVALQTVFEMGFSFVIQQLAAHEAVRLALGAEGAVRGDAEARARLASVLRLSVGWYTAAAAAMGAILAPLGMVFFARRAAASTAHVAWLGPWLLAVAASMLGLWCTPLYSFLDGCGHVGAVAAMRLNQAIASSALAWAALVLHRGLYAPALVILGQSGAGFFLLASHRRLLGGLLGYRRHGAAICWRREVWPFQWRIAVSLLCAYFTMQAFIPILFALRGPVEAGQLGMSLSIAGYLTSLVLPWITTKATPFGQMIAAGNMQQMDRVFLRAMGQAMRVFAGFSIVIELGAVALATFAPRLAARMVTPQVLALLLLAAAANCMVQCLATLLRSFKREPFLQQSLAVALLSVLLALATARKWGVDGVGLSYLAATAGVGLPVAWTIFARSRRAYLALCPMAAGEEKTA